MSAGTKISKRPAIRGDCGLMSLLPFASSFLRCNLLEQPDGQYDQRHRDQQGARPRHHGSYRASVLLPAGEVEEEASRLGDDAHEQEQAYQPLNPVRVSGTVEVEEVHQRQHKQHPGVDVSCPEKLLAELPELATPGKETQQRPTTVFHADQ